MQDLILNKNRLIWVVIIILPTEIVDKVGSNLVITMSWPCRLYGKDKMMIFWSVKIIFRVCFRVNKAKIKNQ